MIGDSNRAALSRFTRLVLEKNKEVNLTAITDEAEFKAKNIGGSLGVANIPEFQTAEKIIDIGTGAGFPGIPLAIVHPKKSFLLLDAVRKKVDFLWEVIDILKLENVKAHWGRAEDLGHDKEHRECYDLCLARAVAPYPTLLEYALPLVQISGHFLAHKTAKEFAAANAPAAAKLLGGRFLRNERNEPQDGDLIVSVFCKEWATESKYPRRKGLPRKRPLA